MQNGNKTAKCLAQHYISTKNGNKKEQATKHYMHALH